MEIKIDFEEGRVQDLLTNAFEGGSNYWYIINNLHYPNKCPKCGSGKNGKEHRLVDTIPQTQESLSIEFEHIELPFKGGSITIGDLEDDTAAERSLTYEAIQRGMRIMA